MNWEENYLLSAEKVAHYNLEEMCVLEIAGQDAAAVMQGQSTSDVLSLGDNRVHMSSLLTPQGKIISAHFLWKFNDQKIWLLLAREIADLVLQHLDKHIIMEDAELRLLTKLKLVHVCGAHVQDALEFLDVKNLSHGHLQIQGTRYVAACSMTGLEGFIVASEEADVFEKIESVSLKPESFKALRMEAGFAIYGEEYDAKTLLPETGLQLHCVSYTKGCFTGQEIVARVKYRGSVNRYLNALITEEDLSKLEKGVSLIDKKNQKLGVFRSCTWSPTLKAFVSFAYLNKNFRQPGQLLELDVNEQTIKATVSALPPVKNNNDTQLAEDLYHEALEIFAKSNEEDDIQAEPLLKRALFINPNFSDAYEALGVLLSRHERYDEAIELMKRLKELNKDAIMAYTNLSVFYMKKGMIDEAESEKQEGTLATFRIAAAKRKQRISSKSIAEAEQAERERRKIMFEQVLEIDEDDLAANFGLGKLALDTKDVKNALTYLQKCIKIKKDYSAAYTLLAKSFIINNDVQNAEATLKQGIVVAHEKGELMPKQEMEMLLAKIRGVN